MTRRFVAIFAILALSACSSEGTSPVVSAIKGVILPSKPDEAPASGGNPITREMIENNGLAMFRGRLDGEEFSNILSATSLNGNYVTYVSAFRQSVTLLGSLVTGTRGLGRDLLSVRNDPNDPVATLTPPKSWPDNVTREYRFPAVGPEGKVISVSCSLSNQGTSEITIVEVTYDVTSFSEHCSGDGIEFTNTYMADTKTGQIWRSKQWIGNKEGYLHMDTLEPFTFD